MREQKMFATNNGDLAYSQLQEFDDNLTEIKTYYQNAIGPYRDDWKNALLKNVKSIAHIRPSGCLAIHGPNIEPILTTNVKNNIFMAAGEIEDGRVVVLTHQSYLDMFVHENFTGNCDTSILWQNIKDWLLEDKTLEVTQIKYIDETSDENEVIQSDIILWNGMSCSRGMCEKILSFVKSGGGLVCALMAYQSFLAYDIHIDNLASNDLFEALGLNYTNSMLEGSQNGIIEINQNECGTSHILRLASQCIIHHKIENIEDITYFMRSTHPETGAKKKILIIVKHVFDYLSEFFNSIPTKIKPLKTYEELSMVKLHNELVLNGAITKVRGLTHFPGDFEESDTIITTSVSLEFFSNFHEVFPTGCYVAAGHTLCVMISSENYSKWILQIGCHTDILDKKESLSRYPKIFSRHKLDKSPMNIICPYGGLIYFISSNEKGSLNVTLNNIIKAPSFNIFKESFYWPYTIHNNHGLWGDLEGEYVIVTLPRDTMSCIEFPTKFLTFWDSVVETHHDLRGTDPKYYRKQWIVPDLQPRYGWMHAGYPIVTHMSITGLGNEDAIWNMEINTNNGCNHWGLFHEIGHNMQRDEWTFAGTKEVTCNIFSLHAIDALLRVTPFHEQKWFIKHKSTIVNYIKNDEEFSLWKKKPFLALTIYAQLKDAFGWNAYKKVFLSYEKDIANKVPITKTDQEKIDTWFKRFSETVSHNLSPLCELWKIPLSEETKYNLQSLPPYLPDDELINLVSDKVKSLRLKYDFQF